MDIVLLSEANVPFGTVVVFTLAPGWRNMYYQKNLVHEDELSSIVKYRTWGGNNHNK